jgi:hypothetical protein
MHCCSCRHLSQVSPASTPWVTPQMLSWAPPSVLPTHRLHHCSHNRAHCIAAAPSHPASVRLLPAMSAALAHTVHCLERSPGPSCIYVWSFTVCNMTLHCCRPTEHTAISAAPFKVHCFAAVPVSLHPFPDATGGPPRHLSPQPATNRPKTAGISQHSPTQSLHTRYVQHTSTITLVPSCA